VRTLLDESLPRTLKHRLSDVKAGAVFDRRWAGMKNGRIDHAVARPPSTLEGTRTFWSFPRHRVRPEAPSIGSRAARVSA